MAVVALKSNAITNRDATPMVKNSAIIEGGPLRESVATIEIATGNSSASTYTMLSIPSNARVSQILLYSDDMGTGTVADFGLYKSTADGGAVVDADFFASAVSLNSGAVNGTDICHEAGTTYDIDDAEKPIWSALGLSSDPHLIYDLVATLTVAADTGGTLTLKCRYVI